MKKRELAVIISTPEALEAGLKSDLRLLLLEEPLCQSMGHELELRMERSGFCREEMPGIRGRLYRRNGDLSEKSS